MRAAGVVVLLSVCGASAACSVLLDWNGFSGAGAAGGDDSGSADEAASGEDSPATCGAGVCVAAPPTGWTGPVALFVSSAGQGAPPACGPGFAAAPVFDGNADLIANQASCSPCSCGSATGVGCAGPVMTFYFDDKCMQPCGAPLTLSTSCSVTMIGCRSATVGTPTPSGGGCSPLGGNATRPQISWGTVARACGSGSSAGACGGGSACVPARPPSWRSCVMQAGVTAACPAGYPSGPEVYYRTVNDLRGCSTCTCSPPSGGQCSVASPAGHAYVSPPCVVGETGTITAPSPCGGFSGGESLKLDVAPSLDAPGSCAITGGGEPSGAATPADPVTFCCAL
jgi:hypothetical protein